MRLSRHNKFVETACLLLIIIATRAFPQVPSQSNLLEKMLLDGRINSSYDEVLRADAEIFVKGTRFSGRLNIGAPKRDGYLTITAIDLPDGFLYNNWRCNCRSDLDSIVCDSRFLRAFVDSVRLDISDPKAKRALGGDTSAKKLSAYVTSESGSFLGKWIIGHEIGHIIHAQAAAFQSQTAQGIEKNVLSAQAPFPADAESAADQFFISHIPAEMGQFFAWITLSNLVAREYAAGVEASYPAKSRKTFDPVFNPNLALKLAPTGGPHPPLLVRVLNLEDEVLRTYPSVTDTTGYFAKIRNQLRIASDGFEGSTFCSAKGVEATTAPDRTQEGLKLLWLATNGFPELVAARVKRILDSPTGMGDLHQTILLLHLVDTRSKRLMGDIAAAQISLRLVSEDLESTRQASPLLVDTAAAEKVLLMTDRSRETLAKIFEDANNAMNEKPQKPMEALLAFDGLVTVGEAAFGTDSDQVVFFLTRLADIGAQYGLSSEALSLLEQRLGTFRKDFREHPIAFSTSVVLVAQLSTLTGNADHSFSVAEAEIAVFDRPTESDYRAIEFLSFALGREAMRASEPRTAERLFRRALDTSDARIRLSSSTNVNEENSRIFMRSLYLNQIGYSQILQEHFEDALPVLSEAADLAARVLPIDDPEYATRLHNLGQALAGVGRYKEAEVKVQQALTIRTKKLGEQDVKTMQTAALLKLIQDAMK